MAEIIELLVETAKVDTGVVIIWGVKPVAVVLTTGVTIVVAAVVDDVDWLNVGVLLRFVLAKIVRGAIRLESLMVLRKEIDS